MNTLTTEELDRLDLQAEAALSGDYLFGGGPGTDAITNPSNLRALVAGYRRMLTLERLWWQWEPQGAVLRRNEAMRGPSLDALERETRAALEAKS